VISTAQCRAAREILGWSQMELADRAGLRILHVIRFEAGRTTSRNGADEAIVEALEAAGVIFEENGEGAGVRLRKGKA
jgi:transcriptional regulator with XRE-family HTH domain